MAGAEPVTTVVDLDARLPALPPEPEEPSETQEAIDVALGELIHHARALGARGRRHAWKARPLRVLMTRVERARQTNDPYGSLLTYLDELVFLQSELRQVIATVRDLTDEA
jgi:hypothetical protein